MHPQRKKKILETVILVPIIVEAAILAAMQEEAPLAMIPAAAPVPVRETAVREEVLLAAVEKFPVAVVLPVEAAVPAAEASEDLPGSYR